jgi:predicted amidohydrolase YtcJ
MYSQHTLSSAEDNVAITAWEQLNAQIPIAPLHWSIAHALTITPQNVQRLKALGGGLALHGFRYLAGTPTSNGPPYRMIVDSGIKVGVGSDSAQISTLNPWLMLYYMVTHRQSPTTGSMTTSTPLSVWWFSMTPAESSATAAAVR